MKHLKFECLRCGSYCKKIIINNVTKKRNIKVGLCLQPKERKLFRSHNETKIFPYIGLQRENWPEPKIIMYQMVSEPCPLLNTKTNLCTIYDKRPLICRSFPFSFDVSGLSIENNCTFSKKNIKKSDFGEIDIIMPGNQKNALINLYNLFAKFERELKLDKKLTPLLFDFEKKIWLIKKIM